MSGVMIGMAPCIVHGGIFEFYPDRVQTIWTDPETRLPADHPEAKHEREPVQEAICSDCCKRLNDELRSQGKEPKFTEQDSLDWMRENLR